MNLRSLFILVCILVVTAVVWEISAIAFILLFGIGHYIIFIGYNLLILLLGKVITKNNPAEGKWLRAASVLSLLILVVPLTLVMGKRTEMMKCDRNQLKRIGIALNMYAADWNDQYPPEKDWEESLSPYVKNARVFEKLGWNTDRPDTNRFHYTKPKPEVDPENATLITETEWADEVGVILYLHGDYKVETKVIWPWWKYVLKGTLPPK